MFSIPGALIAELSTLVEPLAGALGRKPKSAHADRFLGDDPAAANRGQIAMVAEVVAASQISSMKAEPALEFVADGWRCGPMTELTVTTADGVQREYRYSAGTLIRVRDGLLQFPASLD